MPKSDQPFKWDIYKTLHYFIFTIVGGLVYLCILFLYVQKLGAGHDEFAQLFNLPLTVNPPASNPSAGGGGGGGGSGAAGGGGGTAGPPSLINHSDRSPKRTFLPPPPQLINLNNNKTTQQSTEGDSKKVVAPIGGAPKEPTPPGSPLSPYFLLSNQNSCANVTNTSNKLKQHEEESLWHQPRVQSVPMGNHRQSSPQLDRLGVAVSGVGNGNGAGAHPSRAYHLGHEHIPPLIPPFPDPDGSVSGRNGSFGPVDFGSPIGSELGMPPYPGHHHQSHHGMGIPGLGGHQPEPHYQKIPLSPDFSYCLR